ncbi:unnamed protein product [Blumeria hordei]|uniref:AAA+ ATPase domain-containing protein n=1 Tax=Blumeria hordei TaxID=2867405 RepID=A0A383ULD3_BLUHO|nr:unnamed protein product [Blumeria hordei]
MSTASTSVRCLEVKIRPYSGQNIHERPDQKGVARVHLCREALSDLNLVSGQVCYVRKCIECEDQRREAIVWLTSEKSLSKKVIQMSKTFQEVCGFKLGDDLLIQAAGNLITAESVTLKDITPSESELGDEERPHWEWYIQENLTRAEVIFPGMTFKGLSLRGPKRTMSIELINGSSSNIAKYEGTSCSIKISTSNESICPTTTTSHRRLEVLDVAGIDQALSKLNRFLRTFSKRYKITWTKGSFQRSCAVLLHGGRGTGKTYIINKIIDSKWARQVFRIEIDAKPSTIRATFKEAKLAQPSIIVIDELESLVSSDDTASRVLARVLGEELDTLSKILSENVLPQILVVAATIHVSSIPITLRKRGRFHTDVMLSVPDAPSRKAILKSLAPPLPPTINDEVLDRLGERTHAYTAEDLVSLLHTALDIAEERVDKSEDLTDDDYLLSRSDIEKALQQIRPTAMYEISLKPPSVRWDEIGGQENVMKALRRAVETPLLASHLYPETMKRVGASAKKGLLLYGPPGCSKTLCAQAMATETGLNFFAVKGAEPLNMYVGESERAIRDVFARARAASPSIIFFDEIESIGSKREKSGRNTGINVLTTLLNEMDGIETLKGVIVLAATNQPEVLDLALLRPGRFDQLLYVAPPNLAGREEILRVRKRLMDLADDVDLLEIARLTEGYSGAELVSICQIACENVVEECIKTGDILQVHMDDFLAAIKLVKKQLTPELITRYERWASGTR